MSANSVLHPHKAAPLLVLTLVFGLLLSVPTFSSPIQVNVGGYLFEPFVKTYGVKPSGLTLDLIELLNQHQSRYRFQFIHTSPKRRYHDFKRRVFDVMFFESKHWGWQDKPIEASKVFLKGGEVYISKVGDSNKPSQSFFDDLKSKSLVAILGYHYGFAGFDSNETTLNKQFDITLVNSPQTIISQVLAEKAQIGVVTVSYLKEQLKSNTQLKEDLFVSNKMDQEYQHTILVRKGHSSPSLEEMNTLLDEVAANGSLGKLLDKYGIEPFLTH